MDILVLLERDFDVLCPMCNNRFLVLSYLNLVPERIELLKVIECTD
jgi:hypothetical protein